MSKSDLKYQKFDIRIFPGISGSGFFPEKKLHRLAHGQTLGHFDRFVTNFNDISPSVHTLSSNFFRGGIGPK